MFLTVPAWAEREEQSCYLQIKPHILLRPTVQVKGLVVFRHQNVTNNVISLGRDGDTPHAIIRLATQNLQHSVYCFPFSQYFHVALELLSD